MRVRMAANHWKLAVETHNVNLPHADHDVADISQVDPRRYPTTDLLWASPECTNHSQAKGRRREEDSQPDLFGEVLPDAAADRSRATMWDVPRFVEAMQLRGKPYAAFVVENVVDVRDWMYHRAWRVALTDAGYCLHEVYLNSMHAQGAGNPAPQSRDRWYCVGHLATSRCPDLDRWARPVAWCSTCERHVRVIQAWKNPSRQQGRYRAQYVYRCPSTSCRNQVVEPAWLPAASAIDWSSRGQRIGDRPRPLAAKTIARIEAGLRKYARPVMVPVEGRNGKAAAPYDHPMRTQTARNETGVAVPPFLAPLRSGRPRTIGIDEPLATIVANGSNHALLVPAGGTWNDDARTTADPFRARTTRENEGILFPPSLVMRNNNHDGDPGSMCTPVSEVLRTITTKGHQSLVSWATLYGYDSGRLRSPADVLPTQTTVNGDALISGEGIPDVDDCWFRMLEPGEIQAAMAFAASYVVLGNKREKVRQLGNAVTPPAARDLIAAVAESLGQEMAA